MKGLFIAGCFLMLSACATIGPEHEKMSRVMERAVENNEAGYKRLVNRLEEDGRKYVNLSMIAIHGPKITRSHMTEKDANGNNFTDKFCKKKSELGRAREALRFMLKLSKAFEAKKREELQPLINFIKGLQSVADREFLAQRQGMGSLTNGLRAYNKDKKWQKDMLRSLDVPVDQAEALNRSGKNLRDKIKSRLE